MMRTCFPSTSSRRNKEEPLKEEITRTKELEITLITCIFFSFCLLEEFNLLLSVQTNVREKMKGMKTNSISTAHSLVNTLTRCVSIKQDTHKETGRTDCSAFAAVERIKASDEILHCRNRITQKSQISISLQKYSHVLLPQNLQSSCYRDFPVHIITRLNGQHALYSVSEKRVQSKAATLIHTQEHRKRKAESAHTDTYQRRS